MLGNKVSPASLYTDSSIPNDALSCGEESQLSQTSLFGGSDVVSSLELFSQPVNSSQSQTIQSQSSEHTQRHVGTSLQLTTSTTNHTYPSQTQNQTRNGPKYYMRYLSSVSLSKMKAGSSVAAASNETPLCNESRVGSNACSNASYDVWNSKQREKFDKQMIVEEVMKGTRDIAKGLSDEIEGLRKELKTIATQKSDQQSLLTDQQTRGIFAQLLQGQAELKQQLLEIQRQLTQEKAERELLCTRISSLETTLVTTVTSNLEKQVRDCLTESLESAVTNGLKKHTCVITKPPATSNLDQNIHSTSPRNSLPSHVPCDQAVPNTVESNSALEDNSHMFEDTAKKVTNHSSTVSDHTVLKTSTAQETTVQSVPMVTNNGRGVLNSVLAGDTSQGSVSTPCDIDLTQESPSVCSQVISQHLERCASGSTSRKRLAIKSMDGAKLNDVEKEMTCSRTQQTQGNDKQDQPTPRKMARKVKSCSTRGGRTNTKEHGARSKQSTVVGQRRSQRVRQKKTYTFKQEESSDEETPESVGSFGGSSGGIRRRVTSSKIPRQSNILNGIREQPTLLNSPMNALDDTFYSQSQSVSNTQHSSIMPTTTTNGGLIKNVATSEWKDQMKSQPTTSSHLHSADKFHRSSEAAKRRKRIIAELSSSDPVFHEINESIRQQKMLKSEH